MEQTEHGKIEFLQGFFLLRVALVQLQAVQVAQKQTRGPHVPGTADVGHLEYHPILEEANLQRYRNSMCFKRYKVNHVKPTRWGPQDS